MPRNHWLPSQLPARPDGNKTRSAAWLYLVSGAAAAAASPWLCTWLLARTAEPATVGQYGLAMAWLSPLFVVGGLQLRPLLATATDGDRLLCVYRRLRVTGIAAIAFMVGSVALFLEGGERFSLVLAAATLPKLAELLSDFSYGWYTRRLQFRRIGISQVLRASISAAAFATLWLLTRELTVALTVSGLTALAISLLKDEASLARDARAVSAALPAEPPPTARHDAARILELALPLTGVMFLNHAVVAIPRLRLGHWWMLDELASLTALMSLMAVPTLIATAYAASLAPRFAAAWQMEGGPGLASSLQTANLAVLLAAIPGSVFLLLAGDHGLRYLFGEPYAVGRTTLTGAAWFAFTWAIAAVYGTAATAARRVLPQTAAFSAGLVMSGICVSLWIPGHGVAGATWSLGAAGTSVVLVYLLGFHRTLRQSQLADKGQAALVPKVSAQPTYFSTGLKPMDRKEVIADVR